MPKLTKRVIDAAELREQPYFIWCSELAGFGVRIFPSGSRTYYADYRNKSGGRKRMTLGAHGKLTTEEARKLALITLGDVLRGEDPAEERATRRNSMTMKQLCDKYLNAAERGLIMGKRGKPKKASTLGTDRGRIERHIKPLLGTKRVRDVTAADLNRFIRDIAAGKTATMQRTAKLRGKAIVKGGAGTATRTAGLLGGILSFAVSEGVIHLNPARGVKRPSDNHRQRRLTAEEYRHLGEALEAGDTEAEIQQGLSAAWLLALTGCRLGEVVRLKWSEIDEASKCLRLADSKEGASVRPLGQPALDVLAKIARRKDCPFALPAARGEGPFGGMPGAWARIAKRAKLEDVTPHTLRHSFASVAGDLGFAESTIAALLGHAAGSITGRYIHHLDAVLIAAADKVSRVIHKMMTEAEVIGVQPPSRKLNG